MASVCIGLTPWVGISQPVEVASGEPQLPTCSSSQAAVGPCRGQFAGPGPAVGGGSQANRFPVSAHNARCAADEPGKSAILRDAGPVRATALNEVRWTLSSSRGVTETPLYAV